MNTYSTIPYPTKLFLIVWATLYFLHCWFFSRKNDFDSLFLTWASIIGTLVWMGTEVSSNRQEEYYFGLMGITVIFIIPILWACALTQDVVRKHQSGTSLIIWQHIITTLLYFSSLIVGLVSVNTGFFLLALSFIGSIIVYRLFLSGCMQNENGK